MSFQQGKQVNQGQLTGADPDSSYIRYIRHKKHSKVLFLHPGPTPHPPTPPHPGQQLLIELLVSQRFVCLIKNHQF